MLNIDDRLIKEVSPKIGPNALSTLLAISIHLNQKTGSCFPSHEKLMELTGMGRDAVYKALAVLKEHKILVAKQAINSKEKTFGRRSFKVQTRYIHVFIAASDVQPLPENPDTANPDTANQETKQISNTLEQISNKETPTPLKGERGKAASIFDGLDQFYNQFDNPVAAELLFGQWCAYRLRLKKKYKTDIGARHGIRNLLKLSGGNVEQAHKIAAFAMDKEWTDFYPIPEPPKAKPTPNGYGKLPDDYNPYAHHNVIR
jgi:hypothetical protein